MKYCSLEAHIVEVDVIGPGQKENLFTVKTIRHNPAVPGAVTGNATYASFLSSMLGETLYFSIAMFKTILLVVVATLQVLSFLYMYEVNVKQILCIQG